jgi:hypothetical protein
MYKAHVRYTLVVRAEKHLCVCVCVCVCVCMCVCVYTYISRTNGTTNIPLTASTYITYNIYIHVGMYWYVGYVWVCEGTYRYVWVYIGVYKYTYVSVGHTSTMFIYCIYVCVGRWARVEEYLLLIYIHIICIYTHTYVGIGKVTRTEEHLILSRKIRHAS